MLGLGPIFMQRTLTEPLPGLACGSPFMLAQEGFRKYLPGEEATQLHCLFPQKPPTHKLILKCLHPSLMVSQTSHKKEHCQQWDLRPGLGQGTGVIDRSCPPGPPPLAAVWAWCPK